MEKRRKKMCDTCIYRTGELTRFKNKHGCHEHQVGKNPDDTVACAGSCRPKGMELIDTETPNREGWGAWGGRFGAEASSTIIRDRILKGDGVSKMSDSVRLYKLSKGKINHII